MSFMFAMLPGLPRVYSVMNDGHAQDANKLKPFKSGFFCMQVDANADQTPIGYRCNFCVEVHPTLRAICNHLRKHVQYGEAKEGQLKVRRV